MRLAALLLATTLLAAAAAAGQSRIISNSDWTGSISYSYDASGNVTAVGTDTFRYDGANRLVTATINGIQQTFEYDVHGNRTKCKQGTSAADCQQAVIGDYNRISNASYDNAGNLQQWNGSTYAYDALGMVTATEADTPAAKEYLYTADDERIGTYRVGAWWQWTVRGLDGKVLREFTSNGGTLSTSVWTWSRDNIWRDGLLLASKQKPAAEVTTYHYHLDHLGTPRLVTTPSGTPVGAHDYFAFGAETPGGTTEPQPSALRFTGHEREDVGGAPVDYMHARYYSPVAGRFLSVDPTWESADLGKPQSWNRYSYVRNDPVNLVDPDGRVAETPWDIFNIGVGLVSLGANLAAGNLVGAAVDTGGLLLDAAAAATPGAPGGAGTAIRAARLAENARMGRAFENAVVTALGASKNSGGVSDIANRITTIPDLAIGSRFGVTDIKNVKNLSSSAQLRAQFSAAKTAGVPFNLVVSPRTTTVSTKLQTMIESTGGKIFIFDPKTEKFRQAVLDGNKIIN